MNIPRLSQEIKVNIEVVTTRRKVQGTPHGKCKSEIIR